MSRVEDKLDLPPAEKRALLAELLRKKAAKRLPLSFAQQRLWFLDQLDPGNASYNISRAIRLKGALALQALRQALNSIIARHESLRTNFTSVEGEPVQVVASSREIELQPVDLSELAEDQRENEARRLASEEAARGLNLAVDNLLKATLFKLNEQDHVLLLVMHHIVSDGWSMGVLFRELSALYEAFSTSQTSPLTELPIQYADFARWQRKTLKGPALEEQLTYWKEHLAGAPPVLELSTDRPRPATESFAGSYRTRLLSKELTQSLNELSRSEGVTLFMTLMAAFQSLLFRYTGQEDIVVGTPISGRNRIEIENLIGFFVNTLPLRTNVSDNPTFRQMLGRVKEATLGGYAHQDLPFEKLVEELNPERDVGHSTIFQVMFGMQNAPRESLNLKGLTITPFALTKVKAKFDLSFYVSETDRGLNCWLEYKTDLFDADTISRLLGHFEILLESIVANPNERLSYLPLLTAAERQQLLQWNEVTTETPSNECLHELFELQADRTPENTALVFEDEQLTYKELNARANQLAHHLRHRGIGPEALVGICVERSMELVIGLLGILKAGAAYVPLDPSYPEERLRLIVEESGIAVVLTDKRSREILSLDAINAICLDADWNAITQESRDNPTTNTTPGNLAYVLYTSGSTGKPKGVAISHGAICNHMDWMQREFPLSEADRVLQKTPVSFDASVWEFYAPLLAGAQLVMARPGGHQDSAYLVQAILQHEITVLQVVPTLLRLLLDEERFAECRSLTRMYCGGEPLTRELVECFTSSSSATLTNLYGPTETTIDATYWTHNREDQLQTVTIGRPVTNTQAYVLDKNLQPVPVGVRGELYLGGAGLARGYLNRADLTAERFIPDPFGGAGARIYQTGDLVRYLPDGNIEYFGRTDFQVKLRGFRIELGEIERVIKKHAEVREAIVLVREDEPGDLRLVAYVVPQNAGVDVKELREYLRTKLPEYMLPSAIVELKALPLTPNGKVDRRALPAPQLSRSDLETLFQPPRTHTEKVLAAIWSEILKVESIGIHDNFFHLGGHSLLAVKVISRIRVAFNTELPLRSFFESPTITACAERIEIAMRDAAGPQEPPLVRASREGDLPLSFAQQRLWFLNQLEGDSPFYNIPLARRLRGPLDVEALRRSLESIVRRHETLRTNFAAIDGKPVQVIHETPELAFSVVDLTGLNDADLQREIERLGTAEAGLPFDLSADSLLRVEVLLLREQDSVLLMTMHHIVSDAWSMELLIRELAAFYEEFTLGTPSHLPALPVQYADYSEWQREWLESESIEKQLTYWKDQLSGIPSVLELPKDRPRPAVQNYRGRVQSLMVPTVLAQQLTELSHREGVTLFTTLLAALQTLLWRYTGQDDVVVGTPVAGRNRPEIEGLIGFFVNTLVLRADVSGDPTFREFLARVKEVVLNALANQDLPFEKLVDVLQPERSLSRTPLFQVNFTLHNVQPGFALQGLELERLAFARSTSKFDLILTALERPNHLSFTVEYNTALFDDSRIARMLHHFQTLLEGIVENPETKVWELSILIGSEREQLIVEWNQTTTNYGEDRCVHEMFSEQVERVPDSVAVVFKETPHTYVEIDKRANQVARMLRKQSIGPESVVGIFLERSPEMVIGLLGILKAGGAYLPLDPEHPQELLSYMLADAHASIVLTQESLRMKLPESTAVICIDTDSKTIAEESTAPIENIFEPDNLAYVIYTSGSTGKPRGVMVTHRGIANYLNWCTKAYRINEGSGSVVHSPLTFDLTVTSLLAPLVCGQRVTLLRDDDGIEELGLALSEGSDHSLVKLTPSHLEALSQLLPENAAGKTRALIVGGEALFGERLSFWRKFASGTRIINEYGPTETVVGCCVYEAGDDSSGPVPIGKPIANTSLYILDDHFAPLPVGVPGELYIGGAGVARGYLNQPELTAEKFIPDPFSNTPGERLYRSGDIVRYQDDGNLEYIGRRDHQVKLRGYRVELGEIEAVLNSHSQVSEAVVLLREDEPGDKQLVGYVALDLDELEPELRRYFATAPAETAGSEKNSPLRAKAEQSLLADLRKLLKQKLPEHMAPSEFVFLIRLPLTPNGKVDRASLPAPDRSRAHSGARKEPRNDIERQLAEIWTEILRGKEVGVEDNFFQLGGHSLLATQVVSRVRERFKILFPLRRLFEFPTIAELAVAVGQAQQEGKAHPELQMRRKRRDGALLENIDNLSPEQIDSLLAEVLGKVNAN